MVYYVAQINNVISLAMCIAILTINLARILGLKFLIQVPQKIYLGNQRLLDATDNPTTKKRQYNFHCVIPHSRTCSMCHPCCIGTATCIFLRVVPVVIPQVGGNQFDLYCGNGTSPLVRDNSICNITLIRTSHCRTTQL